MAEKRSDLHHFPEVENVRTSQNSYENEYKIAEFVEQFYLTLKANSRSQNTINFYRDKLFHWFEWLKDHHTVYFYELKPYNIPDFLSVPDLIEGRLY